MIHQGDKEALGVIFLVINKKAMWQEGEPFSIRTYLSVTQIIR